MIRLKTSEEIKIMKEGGAILQNTLQFLVSHTKVGMKLIDLDRLAESHIRQKGAQPSFQKVEGYRWTICACVNDIVVHGIPTSQQIAEGDVVGIDCGIFYKGFHTDSATTIFVSEKEKKASPEVEKFLNVGKKALKQAIPQVKIGNVIADVSIQIQNIVSEAGYSVVRTLTGHGVGYDLHEEPEVPCYVTKASKLIRITQGMVLAVEVIYNVGSPEVEYKGNDGWTIVTKDGKLSGLFEATVAATSHGGLVLT